MESGKKKFIEGSMENGYSKKLATDLYDQIEKFSAYGFNKPHSASYGLIAYWTAYMKANYPVEFMTALLTAELHGIAGPMREIKMSQGIEECRRMGLVVLPPDINKSHLSFRIENRVIRFGLSAIKNVGSAAIESIIESRKTKLFSSFRDFLYRVDLRKVNKKTVESLIKAGAFSMFGNRATLLACYPNVVHEIQELKSDSLKGQYGLFASESVSESLADNFEVLPELDEDQLYTMEKEVIGFLLSRDPLTKFKDIIEKKASKKIGDIDPADVGKDLILVGIISSKKIVQTKKKNEDMAFLTIFDETGSLEVVVFPKTFKQIKEYININQAIIFKGKVAEREDNLSVMLEKAHKLT